MQSDYDKQSFVADLFGNVLWVRNKLVLMKLMKFLVLFFTTVRLNLSWLIQVKYIVQSVSHAVCCEWVIVQGVLQKWCEPLSGTSYKASHICVWSPILFTHLPNKCRGLQGPIREWNHNTERSLNMAHVENFLHRYTRFEHQSIMLRHKDLGCSGLNIHVPQKYVWWSPKPQCDGIWKGAFGR